ncbi:hypothetical protein HanXRQr2_Chr17g0791111 [Helianthus annuus]|uniref:Uncharacterized protein n=1 Tax=Helianthus annuus TaxID=4232 RepID=A0A9K3DIF9_HELAN|nr:hypothetical protein HanXRQr2_Chr17g0791111 [Helianthus annuus]KAJ0812177.1 hypothetical protein HanPSC8_Chr17g0759011 [Helianthus annuus]
MMGFSCSVLPVVLTFCKAPRHLVHPAYDEFRQLFSKFRTATVGIAFREVFVTLNAAGQLSEPIWCNRIPQKHKTASHDALG